MDNKDSKFSFSGVLLLFPLTLLVMASSLSTGLLKHASSVDHFQILIAGVRWVAFFMAFILLVTRPGYKAAVKRQLPFIVLVFYILLSAFWTANTMPGLLSAIECLGVGAAAFIAARHLLRSDPVILTYYWPVLLTTMVFFSLLGFFQSSEVTVGRMKGLNGDPSTLGADCMVAIWACYAALSQVKTSGVKILLLSAAALSAIVLIGTRSVTPLLTVLVIVGLMMLLPRLAGLDKGKRQSIMRVLIYGSLPLFFLVTLFLPDIVSLGSLARWFGKDPTFSGRVIIWNEAISLINQQPVIGWGFDYLRADESATLLWHRHFHNGYLDVTVKGGLIGLSLIVFLYTAYLRKVAFLNPEYFRLNIPYVALLSGLLFYNLTEVSFLIWESKLWILTLFGFFMLSESGRLGVHKKRKTRRRRHRVRRKTALSSTESMMMGVNKK